MHIVFLTHYFPPEVNAPASRTYENAKQWVKAGHQVTVITCVPNHPKGIVYPGYENKLRQWDEKDGIRVLRVKTYLGPNKGFAKRIANYVSFMVSAVVMSRFVKDVDLVVSTSPQFFCGLSGYFVSRLKTCPWVLEIRDLWPESIIAVGAIRQRFVIRLLEKIETFMYQKADHIVALTKAFKRHIMARGKDENTISIVTNGADLGQFKVLPRENPVSLEWGLNDKFVASFVGTHGMAHALDTVLRAADRLKGKSDVLFMLVGDGAERDKLLAQKEAMGLKNVLMVPQQPKSKMPEFIAASDVCMVLLRKSELFKTVIPSKIFEAMAMKRPIILGVEGESKEIIERGQCGVCIEPENDQELVDAIVNLKDDQEHYRRLAESGKRFVEKEFDRQRLAEHYLALLIGVASRFHEKKQVAQTSFQHKRSSIAGANS